MNEREIPPALLRRVATSVGIVLLGFFLLLGRLWFLQIVHGDEMRASSEENRIRLVRVPSARGVVYDRHGVILVDNRPSFDVVFVPEDARRRPEVLRTLAHHLGESVATLQQVAHTPNRQRQAFEGIVLRRDADWQDVVAVESHQMDLAGVTLQVGPKRFYPYGPIGAHLLGYVGEVKDELAKENSTYHAGDLAGKSGVEKAMDEKLRGAPGGQQVEVDALGRRVRVLNEVPDQSGATLYLTLDWDLQQAAERALGEHDGAIVALDPRNGDVLAMVSHPSFDPNLFARRSKPSEVAALWNDPKKPLINRAIQGQFPPGSTFKVVVAAAAVEKGLGGASAFCSGGIPFGKHFFRCWRKGGHGAVNLHTAIVGSCDVFFYQMGQRLGIDTIAEFAHRLGLGLKSDIALDNEKAGIIPSTEWKRNRFKQKWFEGETLSVAIGQGYVTATPLQMANLAATIANGGTVYQPHYVRRVEAPDQSWSDEVQPKPLRPNEFKEGTLDRVRAAMRDVVMSESGTGKRARVPGVVVAGKTGTTQVVKMTEDRNRANRGAREGRDHAWFISFAPFERPEIAIACIVEHAGGGGGMFAAPIVQQVLAHYFGRGQGPGLPAAQQANADRPTPANAL